MRQLRFGHSALFLLLASACILSARLVTSDVPHLIALSGRLAGQSGTPLADGGYSVTFRIYDVPEEGTHLWEETDQVTLAGGVFSVILGGLEPLNLGFDTDYWISLSVDGGEEMQPRLRLCGAPYAFNTDRVDGRDAVSTPAAGAVLALDSAAKFPNAALHTGHGEGLDADTVDGYHADDILGGGRQTYIELAPEEPQGGAAVKIEGEGIPLSSANTSPPDGFVWEQRFPNHKPGVRDYFVMSAVGSGDVLLFGGNADGYSDETWIYSTSQADWRLVETGSQPDARQQYAMASDPDNGAVVLFGGFNGAYLGDTWIFDVASETWSPVETENAPAARSDSAMAYAGSGKVVLFGGYVEGVGMDNETWVFEVTAQQWTQIEPPDSPPVRYGHAMAYDSTQGKNVLYGGLGETLGNLDDTWAYDPVSEEWTQMAPSQSPGGLRIFPMTFSSASQECFIFGGFGADDTSDVWSYNLGLDKWERKEPFGTLPGPRRAHGFCYDPQSETFVAFGGFHGGLLGDTWGLEPYQSALAASFDLDTQTTGNEYAYTRTGSGRDLAELLLSYDTVDAGDVVVIDPAHPGAVKRCTKGADTRVAGIVSEHPSLLMGVDRFRATDNAVMIALAGRVACKVDAGYGEIRPGDLLVTSPTSGHAMRADPVEIRGHLVFPSGAIVGKALEGLGAGRGKIQVLVGLR